MDVAREPLEVRCTREDFLPGLAPAPPAGASAFEGVVSVVIEPASKRVRRLPSIYLGPAPVFVSRHPDGLREQLDRLLELLRHAPEHPTYALTPIRVDDHVGLYARDMSVRDTFRMILRRSGVVFADEPFVKLSEAGSFLASWGEFSPEFIILGHYDHDHPEKVLETSGAYVPFTLAKFRLGMISPPELRRLVALTKKPLIRSSASPTDLVRVLRHELGT